MSRREVVRTWVLGAAAGLMLLGCGGSDSESEAPSEGARDRVCIPGASEPCSCADGNTGVQVCSPSGDGYGACECLDDGGSGGSGGGDGGTDDASTGDGGTDGGKDGGNDDPCEGISSSGICVDSKTVRLCSVPAGQGSPSLVTLHCSQVEECNVDAHGVARCELLPGKCRPGSSECTDADQARYCNFAGDWEPYSCSQCSDSLAGAVCEFDGVSIRVWSGTVIYDFSGPNGSLNGWEPHGSAYAQGAMVISYRSDDVENALVPLDVAFVGSDGTFAIRIPSSPGPDDLIAVFAALPDDTRTFLRYAVAIPDVPDGEWDVAKPIPSEESSVWSWAWRTNQLGAPGGTLHITRAAGSGAMYVFDWMRYVYNNSAILFGEEGASIVAWMRPNTSWSCGACFNDTSAKVGDIGFGSQFWIPMTAQDQSYWSDAVTTHELGHWMMASYGRPPLEGGPHTMTCTTFPGQAWSEGFATWLSSVARTNPVYYDKQRGTFAWYDIDSRKYGSGHSWPKPKAADGLLQLIDENEVAAMLWALADTTMPALTQEANQIFFDALESPVVKKELGQPYGRGYKRHIWEAQPGSCELKNVYETSLPVPMFADYLDALRCEGMSAAQIDAVTQPATRYPYPSASPICE